MISREPTIERLQTASDLLLTPFGLTESELAKTLGVIAQHRVDDADLYFQYTRAEGWSLEEGIVKTGSFSIDQGVGVRAVAGEKTAFAYSDDISLASLTDAAQTVRAISSAAQTGRVKVPKRQLARGRKLYPGLDPLGTLDSTAKVQLLERVEKLARARAPSGRGRGGGENHESVAIGLFRVVRVILPDGGTPAPAFTVPQASL